jgi:YD repeat-containing protein
MIRKVFLAIFGFTLTAPLYAQVNLATGSAEQSFPLISYTDSKSGLMINVTANYSSGNGLQVRSLASDLGTGWELDGGGMISRVQVGQPDDQMAYYVGRLTEEPALRNYPDGYLYSGPLNGRCSEAADKYPAFRRENTIYKVKNEILKDMEQDRFVFRFNGRSGTFVIGKDRKPTTLGESRLVIGFTESDMTSQGIRTRINNFTITTEEGIKYTFSELGLNVICRYKYAQYVNGEWLPVEGAPAAGNGVLNRYYGYPIAIEERPYVVMNWYLSSIENTNNGEAIYFNYNTVGTDDAASLYVSHERDLNKSIPPDQFITIQSYLNSGRNWISILQDEGKAYEFTTDMQLLNKLRPSTVAVTHSRSISVNKRLSSIDLPNGGLINIIYKEAQRIDAIGNNAIDRVEYRISGELIRGYQFGYKYLFKNQPRPFDAEFTPHERKFARLCLTSIQKIGNGEDNMEEPPYLFDYYNGTLGTLEDIVPPRNSLAIDHGGYFNGANSSLSPIEDHEHISDAYNQYFKTTLFNSHNPKAGYAKNGLLREVTFPTGGKLVYQYKQNQYSDPNLNYMLGLGVSVDKTTMFDPDEPEKGIVTNYQYVLPDGSSSRQGAEKPVYADVNKTRFRLDGDNKDYHFIGIEYPELSTNSKKSVDVGGMIAGSINNMILNLILKNILTGPQFLAFTIASTVVNVIIAFMPSDPIEQYRFFMTNGNKRAGVSLNQVNSRVKVWTEAPNGGNGYTIHEFTSYSDVPVLVPQAGWPYVAAQRTASWVYGLPKRVAVYDKEDRLVSEQLTSYKFTTMPLNTNNNLNCHCAFRYATNRSNGEWDNGSYGTVFDNEGHNYLLYTGRADIDITKSVSYSNGNIAVVQEAKVINDGVFLLQKGKIALNMPQGLTRQVTYYPLDYTINSGAIGKLKERNALHTPVATETWLHRYQRGTTLIPMPPELIDAKVTEYALFTNTTTGRQEVKPWKIWQLKTDRPVTAAQWGAFNSAVLISHPERFKLVSEMVYDGGANLVEVISNGQSTTYVNNHKNRYVVATAVNARAGQVAYTSFEADSKGGWSYNQAGVQIDAAAPTGSKVYSLASQSLQWTRTVSDNKDYYLTLWSTIQPAVSNGAPPELLYTVGSWKLYRYSISASATSLTITGAGLVDEVRIHPKGSLMSTVSYRDGVGKVSECDANNRIMRYSYDGLGRLKMVRDQNGNIVKTYEYNYKRNP